MRGGCPFPRCPGVPVSTHCPLDQLLGCRQCCSCQGEQSCSLELQPWKAAGCGGELRGTLGPVGSMGMDGVQFTWGSCSLYCCSQHPSCHSISLTDSLCRGGLGGEEFSRNPLKAGTALPGEQRWECRGAAGSSALWEPCFSLCSSSRGCWADCINFSSEWSLMCAADYS